MSEQNLSIIEKEEELIIKHKSEKKQSDFWGTFFLSISSFIIFIAILAGSTSFWFFLVFISIAAFSGMTTLSKAKNNITVRIDKNNFLIEHNFDYAMQKTTSKYNFSTKDIKRLFVARDRKQNVIKNRKVHKIYCYEIWKETNTGKKVRLLGKEEGFFVEKKNDAQIILRKMQDFLQINNVNRTRQLNRIIQPNIGYQQIKKVKEVISRRKINKEKEISKLKIKDLKKGVLLDYQNETWEVLSQIQYDWKQGNTDSLYQLQNAQNTTILLLVCQDMAIYTIWSEERLSYHDLVKHQLDKLRYEPPLEFTFQEKMFFKEDISSGYEFVADNEAAKIKQWKYLSEDKKHNLRILKHEDEDIFVFSGNKIENYEFSNILRI